MANVYAGLYSRLKDKRCPIKNRLKLTKFAWLSDKVVIPNKEQVLIDYLGGLLLNRKKNNILEEDLVHVWRCLYEIFQTKKCHLPSKFGKTLIIKSSICQVLSDGLLTEYKKSTSGCVDEILGCCLEILQSPTLSYVFTTKYEFLVKLLHNILELVLRTVQDGKTPTSNSVSLLEKCVSSYGLSQRAHPNQKQVLQTVTDKLHVPALLLNNLKEQFPAVEKCAQDLLHILNQALLHKEHHLAYEVYLTVQYGEEDNKTKAPKAIEHVFDLFTSLISLKKRDNYKYADGSALRKVASDFLPEYYNRFLSQNCHGENVLTGFRLFLCVCNIIGIKTDKSTIDSDLPRCETLDVFSKLLQSLLDFDLYNVAQDSSQGNVQLKILSHMLHVILSGQRCTPFYSCLEIFLDLNHSILEPQISFILRDSWLSNNGASLDASILENKESVVKKLITTYSKLRHIPKLMSFIFDAVKLHDEKHVPVLSQNITDVLGEVIESLPQNTAVDVWKQFIKEITEKYLPVDLSDRCSASRFCVLVQIFVAFLVHVKVADYTITDLTMGKVRDMMQSTQRDILSPLIESIIPSVKPFPEVHMFSVLWLCYNWGELQLLLTVHCNYTSVSQGLGSGIHQSLEELFAITSDKWRKIHQKIVKADNKRNMFAWKHLEMLVLKSMLINESMDREISALMLNLVVDLPSEFTTDVETGSGWNRLPVGVDDQNYRVAVYDMILTVLPLCIKYMDEKPIQRLTDLSVSLTAVTLQNCSSYMVASSFYLVEERTRLQCTREETTDLPQVNWQAFSHNISKAKRWCHPSLMEYSTWQSCMLTSALRIVQLQSQIKKSPKKQKTERHLVAEILQGLCDTAFIETEAAYAMSEKIQKLKITSDLVCSKLLCLEETTLHITKKHLVCLKHMRGLTVAELSSVEQLRYFLGLLTLLTVELSQDSGTEDHTSAVDNNLSLLILTLQTCRQTSFFQIINVQSYLKFINNRAEKIKSTLPVSILHKLELLEEFSCKVMVRDSTVLTDMYTYMFMLQKTEEDIPKIIAFFLQEVSQALKRSAWNHFHNRDVSLKDVKRVESKVVKQVDIKREKKRKLEPQHLSALSAIIEIDNIFCPRRMDFILNAVTTCLGKKNTNALRNSEEIMASLQFLESVCLCSQKNEELLPRERKVQLWKLLKENFSHYSMKNSHVNSNGNVEGRDSSLNNIFKDKETSILQYFPDSVPKQSFHSSERVENWRWLKKQLMFNGFSDMGENQLILHQIESALAALVSTFDDEQFQLAVNSIVYDTKMVESSPYHFCQCLTSVYLWKQVIQNELTEEKGLIVVKATEMIISNYQNILLHIKDIDEDNLINQFSVLLLQSQKMMLDYGPNLMSPQCATLTLHSCAYIPICTASHIPAFIAVYEILNSMLLWHTETVLKIIPTFTSCSCRLMKFLVKIGQQEQMRGPTLLKEVIGCAQMLNKLFALVASHKLEFSKVAVYIIADYVFEVQQVTLHPAVKRGILPAVYSILDICDTHAVSQLHTVLNPGVKEVFKMLYSDYLKYHRYTGKV